MWRGTIFNDLAIDRFWWVNVLKWPVICGSKQAPTWPMPKGWNAFGGGWDPCCAQVETILRASATTTSRYWRTWFGSQKSAKNISWRSTNGYSLVWRILMMRMIDRAVGLTPSRFIYIKRIYYPITICWFRNKQINLEGLLGDAFFLSQ